MRLTKELLIAAVMLVFGLVPVPMLVYWVGNQIVGEYGAEGGVWALVQNVWSDLAAGNVVAWILVVSPWLILQVWRLSRRLWRRQSDVTGVTTSS